MKAFCFVSLLLWFVGCSTMGTGLVGASPRKFTVGGAAGDNRAGHPSKWPNHIVYTNFDLGLFNFRHVTPR